MERYYSRDYNAFLAASDEPSAAFNSMFSGVSLLSLLTAPPYHPLPPPHHQLLLSPLTSPPGLHLPHPPPLLSLEHPCKRPRAAGESPMVPRGSVLARQRRVRLCEKTRCLQRVLPWDKKMDMATMLEETYKYVKFLQAQLAALATMPSTTPGGAPSDDSFGGLGRLSRSQLLQILVNSPVAQTALYSKGCCVFSVEQLGLIQMKRIKSTANFLIPNPFSPFSP